MTIYKFGFLDDLKTIHFPAGLWFGLSVGTRFNPVSGIHSFAEVDFGGKGGTPGFLDYTNDASHPDTLAIARQTPSFKTVGGATGSGYIGRSFLLIQVGGLLSATAFNVAVRITGTGGGTANAMLIDGKGFKPGDDVGTIVLIGATLVRKNNFVNFGGGTMTFNVNPVAKTITGGPHLS